MVPILPNHKTGNQADLPLRDRSGQAIWQGARPISRSYMVNPTQDLQKYLTKYIPVEVTIIHYLDGRKRDLELEVGLLAEPAGS